MNCVEKCGLTDFEALKKHLECPIDLELLKNAVTFCPCSHKVNELVAKEIIKRKDPCPVCRSEIKASIIDYPFRSLVNLLATIFSFENKAIELKPAFLPAKGKLVFDLLQSHPNSIKFKTQTLGSSVLGFSLDYIRNQSFGENKIFFRVSFNPSHDNQIQTYLCKVAPRLLTFYADFHIGVFIGQLDREIAKKIFEILLDNNEILQEHVDFINEIVKTGGWKSLKQQEQSKAISSFIF